MIQNSEFNAFPAVLEGDSPGIHSDVVALEKMQNDKEYIEDYETAVSTVDDNELSEEVVAEALNSKAFETETSLYPFAVRKDGCRSLIRLLVSWCQRSRMSRIQNWK